MKNTFLLIVTILVLFNSKTNAQSFTRPCGIYALGNSSTSQIRNYPFVDGYVMRLGWPNFETAQGVYNFTTIDNVVHHLDSINQKLTLDILRFSVPNYLVNNPNVEKYTLQLTVTNSVLTAVPWDSIALVRVDTMLNRVANHLVYSIATNSMVPLKDHPVLKQIDATPTGMYGIRDNGGNLMALGTYQRSKFINSIIKAAKITNTYFPNKFAFLTYFGINDNISSPPLGDVLLDSIMSAFNRSGNPKLGFFKENLSCNPPPSVNSITNPLYYYRDSTFNMYQMLQAWRTPHLNNTTTVTSCRTDSTGPDIAIKNGLNINNCSYFEIYVNDLDYLGYNNVFQLWHDSLQAICGTLTSKESLEKNTNTVRIFPNPANSIVHINTGNESIKIIKIYNMTGVLLQEHSTTEFSVSNLPVGLYFVIIQTNKSTFINKLIKQ